MSARFCGRCGQEARAGAHPQCDRALALEPPRFCPECGRRMVVQVTPTDWTARCSRDGELSHGRG